MDPPPPVALAPGRWELSQSGRPDDFIDTAAPPGLGVGGYSRDPPAGVVIRCWHGGKCRHLRAGWCRYRHTETELQEATKPLAVESTNFDGPIRHLIDTQQQILVAIGQMQANQQRTDVAMQVLQNSTAKQTFQVLHTQHAQRAPKTE